MKKKVLLIIILIIGLIGIVVPNYSTKVIKVDKKTYNTTDYEPIKSSTVKFDLAINPKDINNEFMADTSFKMSTYNNVYTAYSNLKTYHYIKEEYKEESSYDKAYNILSNSQKELINKIKTFADLSYYFRNYTTVDNNYYVMIPTIFYLEQITVPDGYVKDKYIIPGNIILVFKTVSEIEIQHEENNGNNLNLDSDSNSPLPFSIYLSDIIVSNNEGIYFKYGEGDTNILTGTSMTDIQEYLQDNGIINDSCYSYTYNNSVPKFKASLNEEASSLNILSGFKADKTGTAPCPIILHNQKGSVNLVVTNKVNGMQSAIVKKGSKLSYKVSIKNTGDADAIDNKVVSTLPEGFIYAERSASNNGVYSNGKVTWNLERIKFGENIDLTYDAYAPEDVNSIKSYIGQTTVSSFTIPKEIEATPTKVSFKIINPETSTETLIIVLSISLLIGLGIYLGLYYKSKVNI